MLTFISVLHKFDIANCSAYYFNDLFYYKFKDDADFIIKDKLYSFLETTWYQ